MKAIEIMDEFKKITDKNGVEYAVITQRWWQGSSVDIHSKHKDKKKALDKANEIYDGELKYGQNAWVMSKSAFKKKYPAIFREEY